MKEKKSKINGLLPILTVCATSILILVVGVKNAISNPNFWEIGFSSCVSILIAAWVSFFLVQRQTDLRKKKDALVSLMTSIQDIVTNEDAYLIDEKVTSQSLTMRTRDLSNHLGILKKYGEEFNLDEDIKFIEERTNEYKEIIGDHITDIEHLSKSALELQRPLNLIEARLFEMILKLY